jgi:hypothetical protein
MKLAGFHRSALLINDHYRCMMGSTDIKRPGERTDTPLMNKVQAEEKLDMRQCNMERENYISGSYRDSPVKPKVPHCFAATRVKEY